MAMPDSHRYPLNLNIFKSVVSLARKGFISENFSIVSYQQVTFARKSENKTNSLKKQKHEFLTQT